MNTKKQQKLTLRNSLRSQRRKLTANQQQQNAVQIANHLQSCQWFAKVQDIVLYLPIDGEIGMQPFIDMCWSASKNICLPVMSKNTMVFVSYTLGVALAKNQFGIPEPTIKLSFPTEKLDAIIVPIVAFDKQKRRLGRGGGYYDKVLDKINDSTLKIGVAHAVQEIDAVPTEPHDVSMDFIVTEKGIVNTQ